jgi:hypothetical protein
MKIDVDDLLLIVGAVLVIGGSAWLCPAAGLIVAGLVCILFSILLTWLRSRQPAPPPADIATMATKQL